MIEYFLIQHVTPGIAFVLGLLVSFLVRLLGSFILKRFTKSTSVRQELRIILDQEDFGKLVGGSEVNKPGCKIILSDIGLCAMEKELDKAFNLSNEL